MKKHLTYGNGDPMYLIQESDKIGPKKVLQPRWGAKQLTWVRVLKDKGDFLMEVVDE
jgi:hypothetical protein